MTKFDINTIKELNLTNDQLHWLLSVLSKTPIREWKQDADYQDRYLENLDLGIQISLAMNYTYRISTWEALSDKSQ